jgi:hypothetical protein
MSAATITRRATLGAVAFSTEWRLSVRDTVFVNERVGG